MVMRYSNAALYLTEARHAIVTSIWKVHGTLTSNIWLPDAAIVYGPKVAVAWYEAYECSSAAPKRRAFVE